MISGFRTKRDSGNKIQQLPCGHKQALARAIKQQHFEYAYLFGAVCRSTGRTEAILAPWVNKYIMCQHLKLISAATEPGRHAAVIVDGVGWHSDDTAKDIANVSINKLPPYSPELNRIEQVWFWLRQNHLANHCFEGYDDILNACSAAWNNFIENNKRIVKLCNRDWANVAKH